MKLRALNIYKDCHFPIIVKIFRTAEPIIKRNYKKYASNALPLIKTARKIELKVYLILLKVSFHLRFIRYMKNPNVLFCNFMFV